MYSRFLVLITLLFTTAFLPVRALSEVIVRDGDIEMTRAEFEQIVSRWSAEMRSSAANDLSDRLELISLAVMNKKLAKLADSITAEENAEDYWNLHFQLQSLKRRFMIKHFVDNLEVPDMSALAEERYHTEKDKYALVPEKRLTSHILFLCQPGQCEREPVRQQAREVLAALRDGANFEEMVEKYSGDPGSKKKGGRFERWFSLGEKGVAPRYSGGAFDIEEIGDYSNLVETQFGVHIIRLDDIQPEHYQSFDEVKDEIERALRAEYTKLAVSDFERDLRISEDARIDGAAMEEIFAPYKSADVSQAGK
jgi:peptidyl-prolyl cis-trans isomerase C